MGCDRQAATIARYPRGNRNAETQARGLQRDRASPSSVRFPLIFARLIFAGRGGVRRYPREKSTRDNERESPHGGCFHRDS